LWQGVGEAGDAGQGWRKFVLARAQIVYEFQRNISACSWEF
jgi:hypothetical protein